MAFFGISQRSGTTAGLGSTLSPLFGFTKSSQIPNDSVYTNCLILAQELLLSGTLVKYLSNSCKNISFFMLDNNHFSH